MTANFIGKESMRDGDAWLTGVEAPKVTPAFVQPVVPTFPTSTDQADEAEDSDEETIDYNDVFSTEET